MGFGGGGFGGGAGFGGGGGGRGGGFGGGPRVCNTIVETICDGGSGSFGKREADPGHKGGGGGGGSGGVFTGNCRKVKKEICTGGEVVVAVEEFLQGTAGR